MTYVCTGYPTMPGAPTVVVDTTMVGGVLRKIQTRYAVLAKPTRVAKLIRTSKNFSTLCIFPMMPFVTDCSHMVVLSPQREMAGTFRLTRLWMSPEPGQNLCLYLFSLCS